MMNRKTLITGLLFSAFIPMAKAQFAEHKLGWDVQNYSAIIAADTDNDGDLDIFGNNLLSGQLLIENDGSNSFIESVNISEEFWFTEHIDIDIDVDGDIDFVSLSDPYGVIAVLENIGGNEFTMTEIYESDLHAVNLLRIQDINLDGLPDISFRLGSQSIKWLENNGDGTFTLQTIANDGIHFLNYCLLDADGDSDADVCILEDSGVLLFCENLGGSYAVPVEISMDFLTSNSFYAFDEDVDGDLDILYTKPDLNEIRILRNLGGGTFGTSELMTSFIQPHLIEPIDLDNDGNLDLMMYNEFDYVQHYYWQKNLGGGVYAPLLFSNLSS